METVTEQINKWIATEGKGNVRDALNIALAQLNAEKEMSESLRRQVADLEKQRSEYSTALSYFTTMSVKEVRAYFEKE